MKRVILIIVLWIGVLSTPAFAQIGGIGYTPTFQVTTRNLRQVVLDDGIYKVSVECQSHTGHKATYTLYVKVQQDNVTYIYFDNGGYIHSGYNNSGYTWRGGGIQWNVDWSGNIINGNAVIQVNYDYGGYQLFTIHF